MDQRELVTRAARGEHEAFDALVRFASNRLYGIAYRVLRDQYLAEDALQQALMTVWNELPRLRDPDRFDAWTYRLIVRAATAEARRAGRGGPRVRDPDRGGHEPDLAGPGVLPVHPSGRGRAAPAGG